MVVCYGQEKGLTCERCGFKAKVPAQIDCHHKNEDHSDNRPENIMQVCANCHRLIHHELRQEKKREKQRYEDWRKQRDQLLRAAL